MDKFYINSIPVYRQLSEDLKEYSFSFFENKETSAKLIMNSDTPEDIQFQTILNIIQELLEEQITIYKDEQFHESGS